MKFDSRKPLWANLTALMDSRWGGENLNRLARECGVSPATATRLKAQQTSVGLETLDKIAEHFGVEPHQLLDPAFNPLETHGDRLSPMARDLGQLLDTIQDPARMDKAYALASAVLQFGILPPDPLAHGAATVPSAGQTSHGPAAKPIA